MRRRTVEELDPGGKNPHLTRPIPRAREERLGGYLGLVRAHHRGFSFTRIGSSFHTFFLLVYEEGVIFAESGPRPTRHFAKVHKPPVG